jgi:hypothetical protein
MTVQAENDHSIHLWIDRQHANGVQPNLELNDADEASIFLAQMALAVIVVAVLFALGLAVWAGGAFVFKGLLHDIAVVAGPVALFFGLGGHRRLNLHPLALYTSIMRLLTFSAPSRS